MTAKSIYYQTQQYLRAANGSTEYHANRVRGILMSIRTDKMLASIRDEIAPKIAQLRHSQELLEFTGNLDNLSR